LCKREKTCDGKGDDHAKEEEKKLMRRS